MRAAGQLEGRSSAFDFDFGSERRDRSWEERIVVPVSLTRSALLQNEKFANFKSICSQMRVSGGWEVMILADWKRG